MRATEVKDALRRRHGSEGGTGEWICIEEAFSGFASMGGGIDVLAIGVWKTAKARGLPQAGKFYHPGTELVWDARNPIVAYEVKVSRADLRRELHGYTPGPNAKSWKTRPVPAWPGKAASALERSHYFMFAVPQGLLKAEEIELREKPADDKGLWIPPEAGLVEVAEDGRCHVRLDARRRDCPPPLTRHEIAELIRHAIDPNCERSLRAEVVSLRARNDELWRQRDALEDRLREPPCG